MEFPFNINNIFGSNNEIIKIDKNYLNNNRCIKYRNEIKTVINLIGEASSKAQKLPTIITTIDKLILNNHILYLKIKNNIAIGFIKIGYKKLFYSNYSGKIIEIEPLCVLDFYVSEKLQRSGHGKEIFTEMINSMNILPEKLAYDKPSPLFISFLRKNYNLISYIPQNNNFVIFDNYFLKSNNNDQNTRKINYLRHIKPDNYVIKNDSTPVLINNNSNIKQNNINTLEEKIIKKENEINKLRNELNLKKNKFLPHINNFKYNPITHTVTNNRFYDNERFSNDIKYTGYNFRYNY